MFCGIRPAAMQQAHHSLTGIWHGLYSHATGAQEAFVAELTETLGVLTGKVTETIKHGPEAGKTPTAHLIGERDHARIRFVKTYDGKAGWDHSVTYEGELADCGCEVEGEWRLQGAAGTFMMIRSSALPSALIRAEAVDA